MIRFGWRCVLLVLLALWAVGTRAAELRTCIPNSLVLNYLRSNPDWSIVDVADLLPDDRELWTQYHPDLCPGIAVAKLDSSSRNWYAVALLKKNGGKLYEKVVLIVNDKHGTIINVLSTSQQVTSPLVLWRTGPGTFFDYRSGKQVTIRHDSLVYEKLESVANQYYLRDGHVHELVATY